MPMFDDPNRELRRLQEQLLAEDEDEQEVFDEEYDEELEALFDGDYEEDYEQEPVYRNYSNRYGADVRNYANGYRGEALLDDEEYDGYADGYEDEYDEDEEPFAVFREEKRRFFGWKKAKKDPRSGEKGVRKLKIILLLEIIGILCVLIWWVVMAW